MHTRERVRAEFSGAGHKFASHAVWTSGLGAGTRMGHSRRHSSRSISSFSSRLSASKRPRPSNMPVMAQTRSSAAASENPLVLVGLSNGPFASLWPTACSAIFLLQPLPLGFLDRRRGRSNLWTFVRPDPDPSTGSVFSSRFLRGKD